MKSKFLGTILILILAVPLMSQEEGFGEGVFHKQLQSDLPQISTMVAGVDKTGVILNHAWVTDFKGAIDPTELNWISASYKKSSYWYKWGPKAEFFKKKANIN